MNAKPRLTEYWVTCADGLETLLQQELESMNNEVIVKSLGIDYHFIIHAFFHNVLTSLGEVFNDNSLGEMQKLYQLLIKVKNTLLHVQKL